MGFQIPGYKTYLHTQAFNSNMEKNYLQVREFENLCMLTFVKVFLGELHARIRCVSGAP